MFFLTNRRAGRGQFVDCDGHGTHVAGLIAGQRYGVAKQARVRSYRALDCTGSGQLSDLASALLAVAAAVPTARSSVVNLSLEYLSDDPTIDAIVALLQQDGVTVVAAAGNDGQSACSNPSIDSGVVAVGASTAFDAVASYSDFGTCVDVFAPGDQLLSDWLGGGTRVLSGTSMACGVVTGAVALYLQSAPSATPAQVLSHLQSTATVGALSNAGAIQNRLLYVGDPSISGGGGSGAPAPPPALMSSSSALPSWAPLAAAFGSLLWTLG